MFGVKIRIFKVKESIYVGFKSILIYSNMHHSYSQIYIVYFTDLKKRRIHIYYEPRVAIVVNLIRVL